jgi:hypothetical protein
MRSLAVRLQNPFHQTLESERRLRTEEIPFTEFGGQRANHLLDQSADRLFLFDGGEA